MVALLSYMRLVPNQLKMSIVIQSRSLDLVIPYTKILGLVGFEMDKQNIYK
jgi:hypothetical protein